MFTVMTGEDGLVAHDEHYLLSCAFKLDLHISINHLYNNSVH